MSGLGFLAQDSAVVQSALRAAVERIENPSMRLIASYQLGWCEADGRASEGSGGKGLRGVLALRATEAAGAHASVGLPGAVAVELVHNFSLLHDDVMDHDTERRHRPTGWVAFGGAQAILAGTAMHTLAAQVLAAEAPHALPCLLDAIQQLVSGQSEDLRLEHAREATIPEVLRMESGKTAALLSCAASIGPVIAGAPQAAVQALAGYGHELGLAFQIVDDVLGIVGDSSATGKSVASDVRARKCSVPIVAALSARSRAARELRSMFDTAPLEDDAEVAAAAELITRAGGIRRATELAAEHVERAHQHLQHPSLQPGATQDLIALGQYVLNRDR